MKGLPYPVLRNRPIDQWKVTELRDELKRRKLAVKGLKEELVRRLGEALREEVESADQEKAENGSDDEGSQLKGHESAADEKTLVDSEPVSETAEVEGNACALVEEADNSNGKKIETNDLSVQATPAAIESMSEILNSDVEGGLDSLVKDADDQVDGKNIEANDVLVQAVKDDTEKIYDQDSGHQAGELELINKSSAPDVKDESVVAEEIAEITNASSEKTKSEVALDGQASENEQTENTNSDSKTQLDAMDIEPSVEEVKLPMSESNNQVSEVSPSLGHIKTVSVSVSNDSVSINEKIELKDNIIADDVKLELDVKHEMVQPSSSPLVPDGGKSRPMDVEEPHSKVSLVETKITVKEEDMNHMSKKIACADLGSPEKLNLDRSSGDESMEEDPLENKPVDSIYISGEVGGRDDKTNVAIMKEETTIHISGPDLSAVEKDPNGEGKNAIAASTEKRKLPDNQEALANNEPSKRQRRWKTETVKASEPQILSPATTPRGMPQALGSKRSFSRSNSNADDDTTKERTVPPSVKAATDSLKIVNFLRPFTLKAVQELLGKTGTVTSFWMDHIKTHCYVTYSSVEEATETRNAVYNLQWPPYGGRLLTAEFVDAEEVKSHIEAPPQLAAPTAPANAPPAAPGALLQPSPRQVGPQQKLLVQTNLPPPPPVTARPPARERILPPPPPLEKEEPPAVTLDDLFRKTKSSPRIYYLPLSEEQVKAKLEVQPRNSQQAI